MQTEPVWIDLNYNPDVSTEERFKPEAPSTILQELKEDNGGEFRDVLPYVLKLVKDAKRKNNIDKISHEELVSVALAALARCRYRLKPKSGAKLTTYAYLPISGALQDFIESELRHYGRETPVHPEALCVVPAPNHYEEKLSNKELFSAVLKALDRINADGAKVIRRHFLEEIPEYKIAEEMGVSSHVVAKLRKQALVDLRFMMGFKPSGSGGWVADPDN